MPCIKRCRKRLKKPQPGERSGSKESSPASRPRTPGTPESSRPQTPASQQGSRTGSKETFSVQGYKSDKPPEEPFAEPAPQVPVVSQPNPAQDNHQPQLSNPDDPSQDVAPADGAGEISQGPVYLLADQELEEAVGPVEEAVGPVDDPPPVPDQKQELAPPPTTPKAAEVDQEPLVSPPTLSEPMQELGPPLASNNEIAASTHQDSSKES